MKGKQVYELAFHINPDLEEAQVQQVSQDIENYITSNKGTVSFKRELEKTRLSYLIKHKRMAYFGYFHFSLESPEEGLANINERFKLNNDVLRYLIVKLPADSGKAKFRFRSIKPRVAPEKPVEKQTPEETKELEKA